MKDEQEHKAAGAQEVTVNQRIHMNVMRWEAAPTN